MLRLLRKKITAQHDFLKNSAFVVAAHFLILIMVLRAPHAQQVLMTMRMVDPRNVVISWRTSSVFAKASLDRAIKKPMVAKKKQVKPVVKKPEVKKPAAKSKSARPERSRTGASKQVIKPVQKIIERVVASLPAEALIEVAVTEVVSEGWEPIEDPIEFSVHEWEQHTHFKHVIQQVHSHWQPPCGAEPTEPCVLEVHITTSGMPEKIVITESSGILAYDIAAKSAILKSVFPKVVWGKLCIFHF